MDFHERPIDKQVLGDFMNRRLLADSTEAKEIVSKLLDNSPPVLVEVIFPKVGTSPDWYLCQHREEFNEIMDSLGAGAELHISSVWDLQNKKGEICLSK
jgi:hypothetical protein